MTTTRSVCRLPPPWNPIIHRPAGWARATPCVVFIVFTARVMSQTTGTPGAGGTGSMGRGGCIANQCDTADLGVTWRPGAGGLEGGGDWRKGRVLPASRHLEHTTQRGPVRLASSLCTANGTGYFPQVLRHAVCNTPHAPAVAARPRALSSQAGQRSEIASKTRACSWGAGDVTGM